MIKCGLKRVLVGLRGGIDSALVAALATEALGAENVTGISMPSKISSSHSISDAKALAENLGIEFHIVPISNTVEAVEGSLAEIFAGKERDVTEENIQSRSRGLILMAMSNKFGALIPSIGLLYKALRASATSAFVFMFASILFAVAAIKPESADATQIFKFSIGFAVFAIQGALCFAVKRRIFSEGKAALITLAATAICLLLLLAMELKKFII